MLGSWDDEVQYPMPFLAVAYGSVNAVLALACEGQCLCFNFLPRVALMPFI